MKFSATIQNKVIVPSNESYVRHHLEKMEGKKVWVTVEKQQSKRSLNQNAYYHLCLQIIANETGHSKKELHRLFAGLFLPRVEMIFNGKKYAMAGSTSTLKVGEFVEYFMKIQVEAAQMGIILPSPDDFKKGRDSAQMIAE